MCIHCMYGEIRVILESLLSFMLTIVDEMFFRLFMRRARRDCTYASNIFVSAVFNLNLIMYGFNQINSTRRFLKQGFYWLTYFMNQKYLCNF